MHTFISLSSPHLGYTSKESKIVRMAMWVYKKMGTSTCLNQLTLSDAADESCTELYRLSNTPGLGWFKTALFVCSKQDTYAPYDSARIESHESKWVYSDMAQNVAR